MASLRMYARAIRFNLLTTSSSNGLFFTCSLNTKTIGLENWSRGGAPGSRRAVELLSQATFSNFENWDEHLRRVEAQRSGLNGLGLG